MLEVYSLVLFVHVVAAVALVGHSLGSPVTIAAIRDAATLPDLGRVVGLEHRLSRLNPLVALVLLASGVYLGSVGWWTQPWFYVSVAGWMINAALAGSVLKPIMGALMADTRNRPEVAVPQTTNAVRRSMRLLIATRVMLANDIALLFIMMNKPGLLESVAVAVVVNGLLVATAFLSRRPAAVAVPSPAVR